MQDVVFDEVKITNDNVELANAYLRYIIMELKNLRELCPGRFPGVCEKNVIIRKFVDGEFVDNQMVFMSYEVKEYIEKDIEDYKKVFENENKQDLPTHSFGSYPNMSMKTLMEQQNQCRLIYQNDMVRRYVVNGHIIEYVFA